MSVIGCNYKLYLTASFFGLCFREKIRMSGRFFMLLLFLVMLSVWPNTAVVYAGAAESKVAGRVLTEYSPIKDARVYVYGKYDDIKSGSHLFVFGPTGADGLYSSSVPQGSYYFVARGRQDGREFFAYHGGNPIKIGSEDTWITLLAQPLNAPVFSEGETGIKGVVTYKGRLLAGAYVTAYKDGAALFKGLGFKTESVSENGRFDFLLQPGKYVLVAKKIESGKGNRPLKAGDLFCYAPNNPVEVLPDMVTTVEIPCYPKDNRTAFIDIPQLKTESFKSVEHRILNDKSGIKGRVVDSSGKPVAGILVLAYRTTKPVFLTYHLSHGTEYNAETAADGSFHIPVDASGDYYMVARDTLGDGPHRGEMFGLYNGNSRHVVAYKQGTLVDSIVITAGKIMDDASQFAKTDLLKSAGAVSQSRFEKTSVKITDAVLTQNTIWSGEVVIRGVVLVKKGVTLTIEPGTKVRFVRVDKDLNNVGDGELRVEGRIVARGTAMEPIVFTSAEQSKVTRDWSYVHLLASQEDNLFEYCRFEYGFSGIQVHYSTVRVTDCLFSNNHEGLHFNTANVMAEHNTFEKNGSAIRFKRLEGRVVITANDIRNNEIGVLFGRQQINAVDFNKLNNPVDYPVFSGNSFHRNHKYNFSMGEGQELDIHVENNWWGTDNSSKISSEIFDKESDIALGRIIFTPFLAAPLVDAGARKIAVNKDPEKNDQ